MKKYIVIVMVFMVTSILHTAEQFHVRPVPNLLLRVTIDYKDMTIIATEYCVLQQQKMLADSPQVTTPLLPVISEDKMSERIMLADGQPCQSLCYARTRKKKEKPSH